MVDILALIISYSSLGLLAVCSLFLILLNRDYYFIYDRRLAFVTGLAFSRSLTDYAITSVLAWYFTYYDGHLVMSAILSNIQSSLSSLLVIFMAHSADSYFGRFRTLLFSNTAYIGGLMLLWLFNPYDVKWLVVIALILLSLGTSGAYILEDLLKDLVHDIEKPEDRDDQVRSRARAETWSRIAYVSGAVYAILWVSTDAVGGFQPSWKTTFLICIITMTITLIGFCKGHNIYHQDPLIERPSQIVFKVIGHHIKKIFKCNSRRSMKFSREDRLETESIGNEGIQQERPTPRLDTTRGTASNNQSDMEIVKSLVIMLPMWFMFFVVSIISATGATFFYLQYTNLNVSKVIPIQINNIAQDFSRFAILFFYNKIMYLKIKHKLKIGVGMLCGVISCICAWRLEVYRLEEVGSLVDKDLNTSISFLWLVPQFCVLGCMEGLTQEGVLKFYELQMEEQPKLKGYGEEYIEVVMGLGKLMNIILVIIFSSLKGWFGDTINDSRLDKYYFVLIIVCSVNFILYCLIARCYYTPNTWLMIRNKIFKT